MHSQQFGNAFGIPWGTVTAQEFFHKGVSAFVYQQMPRVVVAVLQIEPDIRTTLEARRERWQVVGKQSGVDKFLFVVLVQNHAAGQMPVADGSRRDFKILA